MNNYYCGLHLLVGTTNACGENMKNERYYLDEKEAGSTLTFNIVHNNVFKVG
jgi:hypothetical protein